MKIDDKIRDEKVQYDINREAAKISALSSDKIGKYELLTGEEILPSDQSRGIKQAMFTYSPLDKSFEKQIKTIEDQGFKQVEALKALKSEEIKEDIKSIVGIFWKDLKTYEIKNEIDEIKKCEEKTKQKDLKNKTRNCTYDFQQYETIRSSGESIYTCKASIAEAEEDQSNPLENLGKFNNKSRPKKKESKVKKTDTYESTYGRYEGQALTLNTLKIGIFPINETYGEVLKILTPKQMLQKLA